MSPCVNQVPYYTQGRHAYIYILPKKKGNLNHCKGKRSGENAQPSKTKSLTAGPRLLLQGKLIL